MVLIYHLLMGAAIASNVQFFPLALILALLSHYLFDLLPHYQYPIENIRSGLWKKAHLELLCVFLDLSLGIVIILLLSENNIFIFSAAFLAILPDGLTFLRAIFPQNILLKKHYSFHRTLNAITNTKKNPGFWKFFFGILVIIVSIYFLL